MKIALLSLSSPVHNKEKIDNTLDDYMGKLNEYLDFDEIEIENFDREFNSYDLVLTFVKTGGTENIFKEHFSRIPQPIYLLTTSLHNSLPAALEIMNFIQENGGDGRIFHGEPARLAKQVSEFVKFKQAENTISGNKIGVFGNPSDWLIASNVNYREAEKNWGIDFEEISMEEIYEHWQKMDSTEEINSIAEDFIDLSVEMIENNENDVRKASKLYLALKEIVAERNMDALTLRCFDLLDELETTGCLALSRFNDKGIIAGCEGDIPATFTMLLVYNLTDELSFMSNPISIDPCSNMVKFAHCTVPTSICNKYISRSHFESGIGVGVQGIIPKGPVTVIKVGGDSLKNYFVAGGVVKNNLNDPNACRTQIVVEFENDISDYFLKNPLGNHHIIVPGNYSELLQNFFKQYLN